MSHIFTLATVQLSNCNFWPWVLPWWLHPAGGDSSKSWSSGLFRFFDICCSLLEWWLYPPLNRYLLITWDTLNQQDTQHIQQSVGGEKRNANKSQSHSFRSLLYMSSFQRAVCAKLPCGGQPSTWRRSEAWSRSPPVSRRNRTRSVSTDGPGLISLDKSEIFAAEVICRSRALRIMLQTRSDGNYAPRSNLLVDVFMIKVVFVSPDVSFFKVSLDFPRCMRCLAWMIPGDVRLQV